MSSRLNTTSAGAGITVPSDTILASISFLHRETLGDMWIAMQGAYLRCVTNL